MRIFTFVFLFCASVLGAGINDHKLVPLISRRDGPVEAGPRQPLFIYSQGKKLVIFETGVAVAKPKDRASPILESIPDLNSEQKAMLAGVSGKAFLCRIDNERNLKVNGNRVSIDAAAAVAKTELAYVLDIVQIASDNGQASGENMALTPFVVTRFKQDVEKEEINRLLEKAGLKMRKALRQKNAFLLELKEGVPTSERVIRAANQLFEVGGEGPQRNVLFAHPDFVVPPKKEAAWPPSDPQFASQWYLEKLRLKDAWEIEQGRPEVVVAVLDDAVESTHPDIKFNFIKGRRFVGPVNSLDGSDPIDQEERHGTACAGIICAKDNAIGIVGVAPGCKLYGVSMFGASLSNLSEAFYYAADPDENGNTDDGASVFSCSWSYNKAFDHFRDTIDDLAKNGRNGKGIVFVFAAGNQGGELDEFQACASLPGVIVVGAVDNHEEHCHYSNKGESLSVVAPSAATLVGTSFRINTTDRVGFEGYAPGDYTGAAHYGFSGTSAATPMVAGVAALMLSKNSELKAWQVKTILEHTARRVSGAATVAEYSTVSGVDVRYGHGMVDAAEALRTVSEHSIDGRVWPRMPVVKSELNANLNERSFYWDNEEGNISLLVRLELGVEWHPEEGKLYEEANQGAQIVPGVTVVARGVIKGGADTVSENVRYALFFGNKYGFWSWGAKIK